MNRMKREDGIADRSWNANSSVEKINALGASRPKKSSQTCVKLNNAEALYNSSRSTQGNALRDELFVIKKCGVISGERSVNTNPHQTHAKLSITLLTPDYQNKFNSKE